MLAERREAVVLIDRTCSVQNRTVTVEVPAFLRELMMPFTVEAAVAQVASTGGLCGMNRVNIIATITSKIITHGLYSEALGIRTRR